MRIVNGVCTATLALGLAAWSVSQAAAQPIPVAPADQPPVLQPQVLQPMGEPAALEEAPQPKDRVRLQWEDSSIILGELPEEAIVTIKSRLGEFDVKLQEVARIDRAVEENEFRVMFAGGDRVTGTLKFAEASLTTSWGEVPLSVKGLVSMETGKLHARPVYQSRLSPDGRTTVTLRQDHSHFAPKVANPDEATDMTPRSVYGDSYNATPHPATAPQYDAPPPRFSAPVPVN